MGCRRSLFLKKKTKTRLSTSTYIEGGIMLDHACGVVIGATAEVGARTIFYHQVGETRKITFG